MKMIFSLAGIGVFTRNEAQIYIPISRPIQRQLNSLEICFIFNLDTDLSLRAIVDCRKIECFGKKCLCSNNIVSLKFPRITKLKTNNEYSGKCKNKFIIVYCSCATHII